METNKENIQFKQASKIPEQDNRCKSFIRLIQWSFHLLHPPNKKNTQIACLKK